MTKILKLFHLQHPLKRFMVKPACATPRGTLFSKSIESSELKITFSDAHRALMNCSVVLSVVTVPGIIGGYFGRNLYLFMCYHFTQHNA